MSSIEFTTFLRRSLKTVSIDLMGINLIVLKKKYTSNKIRLNPFKDKGDKGDNQIKGTIWSEGKLKDSIEVRIKESSSDKFTIRSDIAKSLYKYYYRGTEEYPSIIHVQTCITGRMERLNKSQYLDALSIIKTIRETNQNLSDLYHYGSVFGFAAKRIQSMFKDRYDKQGLNQ